MPILHLFCYIVVGLLGTAYLAALCLYLKRGMTPGLSNLIQRTNSWVWMLLFLGGSMYLGRGFVITLFAFMSFAALREYTTLTKTRRGDHRALFISFAIVLPLQYLLVYINWYGLLTLFIPVYATTLVAVRQLASGDTQDYLARAARVQWGLWLCVYSISHIPAMLDLNITTNTVLLIIWYITVIQSSDVLQYAWGKTCGKHKAVPLISPNKTVEGLIGGFLSASILGLALHSMTPFSPITAFGMALLCCVLGFFGGLVMSAIKRDARVKDFGDMLPGHGGMLDRIDSLCFSAPIFFHLVRYSIA